MTALQTNGWMDSGEEEKSTSLLRINDNNYQAHCLQLTKDWFKEKFRRDLNEKHWNISFDKLLQEEKLFVGKVAIILFVREGVVEDDEALECAIELYEFLKNKIDLQNQTDLSKEENNNKGLRNSFNEEYKGPVLGYFEKHLDECYKNWIDNKSMWHSPYFSIVQSSGYGKSRLCKEFSQTNLNWLTVYICLRNQHSSGYPPRHDQAINFLKEKFEEPNQSLSEKISSMVKWIDAWRWIRILFRYLFIYEEIQDLDILLDKLHKSFREADANDELEIYSLMKAAGHDGLTKPELEKEERRLFWSLCENGDYANKLHFCVKELFALTYEDNKYPLPALQVLFVLDEARFLINTEVKHFPGYNLFRLFRAGLKGCKECVFAVLVDTTSRVSNFSPPLASDPSNRDVHGDIASSKTQKLFPPFHWITTTDVLCDNSMNVKSREYVFTLGRPLWMSTLRTYGAAPNRFHFQQLVDFAYKKLSCYDAAENHNIPKVIAFLAVLTGMSVSPHSSTAMELVGSYMATCLAIDDDREALCISYPIEPILSEAALNWLREAKLKETVLDVLNSCLRIGIVNSGHSGELVVKLLFLLGRCKISKTFECCTIESILTSLMGAGGFSKVKDDICVLSYELSFTRFCKVIRWDKTFEEFWGQSDPGSVLKAIYERRGAIELPDSQRGADLLLPTWNEAEDTYRYILIQVKNVISLSVNRALNKLMPEFVFGVNSKWPEYDCGFSLLVNVGSSSVKDPIKLYTRKKQHILVLNGLDIFSDLSSKNWDAVVSGLRDILRERGVNQWVHGEVEKYQVLSFEPIWRQLMGCDNDDAMDTNN